MAEKRMLLDEKQILGFLEGQKTFIRFPCKFNWDNGGFQREFSEYFDEGRGLTAKFSHKWLVFYSRPPYQPEDILYVPEPWFVHSGHRYDCDVKILYRASGPEGQMFKLDFYSDQGAHDQVAYDRFMEKWDHDRWNSALTMPMEAVRLHLRVKSARVERLQDIDGLGVYQEGIYAEMPGACREPEYPQDFPEGFDVWSNSRKDEWFQAKARAAYIAKQLWVNQMFDMFKESWDDRYGKPMPVKEKGQIIQYVSYPWDDVQEVRTYKGKPLMVYGNPWVWVVEFERIERRTV